MPNYVFSFIGTGSMGSALARAACRSVPPEKVLLANRTYSKAQALANALGCVPAASNILAAELADYVFLGVKPDQMATVAREIGPALRQRRDPFVLVTMAAGLTMKQVCEMVGSPCPVIRVMPNTPSEVGAGLILYDANERVTERDLAHFTELSPAPGPWTAWRRPSSTRGAPWRGAVRRSRPSSWRAWPTAAWPAGFPGRRRCSMPRRCWRARPGSSGRPDSTRGR